MSEAGNSLIQATADHLSQFAPFDQMPNEHLLWLARHATLAYFAIGEVILSPEQADPVPFFIIKQGVVQGEQGVAGKTEDSAWLELHEGECFPLGALLAHRPVTGTYRASSDVFCYTLPAGDFLQLTRLSAAFYDFCTRRIANLLEQSKHLIQAGYSKASAEQQSMSSSLAAIIRREPVTCAPDNSIRDALQAMQAHGVGAMVAVDEHIPKGIRHMLVTDHGRPTGVVSEKDLFNLQRVGLSQISKAIRHASNLDSLIDRPCLARCATSCRAN
jgi:CBS domain-containing protein